MAEKPKPPKRRLNFATAVGFVQSLYGEDLTGLRVACEAKMTELEVKPNLRRSVDASANSGASGNARSIVQWVESLTAENLEYKDEDANGLGGRTVAQALVGLHATVLGRAKATGATNPAVEKEPEGVEEEMTPPSPGVTYTQKKKKVGRVHPNPEQQTASKK